MTMSEDAVSTPGHRFVRLEDGNMATEIALTKEELLEALSKNGINSLEDLVDAIMPETGGYRILYSEKSEPPPLVTIPHKGSFGFKMYWHEVDAEG